MPRVRRTPEAERDLREIAFYIGKTQHRPLAAENLLREIDAKLRLYAGQPLSGARRSDLDEDARIFVHKRHIIVYRPLDDGIEVMRVLDGSRDFPTLLT